MISDEWYLTDRKGERHRFVCMELAKWMRKAYPGAVVCYGLKSYRERGRHLFYLSPDIDVAIVKDSKLIGCEVKLFAGRLAGKTQAWKAKWASRHGLGLPIEDRVIRAADQEIYKGLGQALFLLRYVHQAYLVIPDIEHLGAMQGVHEFDGGGAYALANLRASLLTLISNYLPVGLLEFYPKCQEEDELEFRVIRGARELNEPFNPMGFYVDDMIQAVNERSLPFLGVMSEKEDKTQLQLLTQDGDEEVDNRIEIIRGLIKEKEQQLQENSDLQIRVSQETPHERDEAIFTLYRSIPTTYITVTVGRSFTTAFAVATGQRFANWVWMQLSSLFMARRLR